MTSLPPLDPFEGFTDDALFNVQLALELSCARTKTTLRNPTRKVLCNAITITRLELGNRGAPAPVAPYHYGQLKRTPKGIVA